MRWGDAGPCCPHCGSRTCYFLRPRDGRARSTRTGGRSARRVWKCGACRRQFSALTGSLLHGTRLPLATWVAVAGDWAAGSVVIAPVPLMQRYALSRDTARRVSRLLARAAVLGPPGLATLLGAPDAAAVRDSSAVRRRPMAGARPWHGPSADYGD